MMAPVFVASPDGTILFLMLSGLIAALLFGLFIPYMDWLTSGRRWIVPLMSGLLAIVMIVKGNAASTFDASQPHPDSIFYVLDTGAGHATWASVDSRPDVFTAQFLHRHVRAGWLARMTGLATFDATKETLTKIPRRRDFSHLNNGRTIEGDAPTINAVRAGDQSARRRNDKRRARCQNSHRVSAQRADHMDGGAVRSDGSGQFDRRQIAGRPGHQWMDGMVLERAGNRLRPGTQTRDARTVRTNRDRSDRRIAANLGIFFCASRTRCNADAVSFLRFRDPGQKNNNNRRRRANEEVMSLAARNDHRSHSPPIMFTIPNVVMMSGIMCPTSILFSALIPRKHGGLTRTRYGRPLPSLTT